MHNDMKSVLSDYNSMISVNLLLYAILPFLGVKTVKSKFSKGACPYIECAIHAVRCLPF